MGKFTEHEVECEECDSPFVIIYDIEETDFPPTYCPFCGEEIHFGRGRKQWEDKK